MTEEQYKEYDKKLNQLKDVRLFLSNCGFNYFTDGKPRYGFKLITKGIKVSLLKISHLGSKKENTFDIPLDLQEKIVKVVEEYMIGKNKELEEI